MKRVLYFFIIFLGLISIYSTSFAIPNPWTECKDDISLARKITGFNFPLRVENYSVRAMKGMIEIAFPYKRHKIIARKSETFEGKENEHGIKDISGVYDNYPVNKDINISGVYFNIRGKKNKYYVVSMAAETGYYSFYYKKGLKIKDIKYLYKLLEEAEAPRLSFDESDNITIEQLQDSRRIDDIVEPVYTQDCFPRSLEKKGVTFYCFERANLGEDRFCSLSEIKMIKDYYKKGQDKDPLNNGDGNFCSKEDNF